MDHYIADLAAQYGRHFDIVPADTPDLLGRAYRLRYQVYCVEHAFLDPADNPGGREIDEFDAHSVHSLLIHRGS
ncbi:MAG: GNAT family N-acyltransferase, partial [Gemmataceae bacterium]